MGDTGLVERLTALVNSFSYLYARQASAGALVQLWTPREEGRGGRVLTTQGAPFSVMGFSDHLALYRWACSRYRPAADGANPKCAVSRVFANLPPELSGPAGHEAFDRCAEAQRCNIRSDLLLAVYDGASADDAGACPVAVLELAQHEVGVDFAAAVALLHSIAQEQGFFVPELESARTEESCEVPLEPLQQLLEPRSGGGGDGDGDGRRSRGSARRPCFFRPCGVRRSSCLVAEAPAGAAGDGAPPAAPGEQLRPQRERGRGACGRAPRPRRRSVIVMDHYQPPAAAGGGDQPLPCTSERGAPARPVGGDSGAAAAGAHWGAVQSEGAQVPALGSLSRHSLGLAGGAVMGSGAGAHGDLFAVRSRSAPRRASAEDGGSAAAASQRRPATPTMAFPSVGSSSSGSGRDRGSSQPAAQHASRVWEWQRRQQQQQQQQQRLSVGMEHLPTLEGQLDGMWPDAAGHQREQRNPFAAASQDDWQRQQQHPGHHSQQQRQQQQQHHHHHDLQRLPSMEPARSGVSEASTRVRALVASGGRFRHVGGSGMFTYEGGRQRLVVLPRLASIEELRHHLCSSLGGSLASGHAGGLDGFVLKYGLPGGGAFGAPHTFVELDTQEDVDAMWEEWGEFSGSDRGGGKLQLYVEAPGGGSGVGSSSGSERGGASCCGSDPLPQPNTPAGAAGLPAPARGGGPVQQGPALAAGAAGWALRHDSAADSGARLDGAPLLRWFSGARPSQAGPAETGLQPGGALHRDAGAGGFAGPEGDNDSLEFVTCANSTSMAAIAAAAAAAAAATHSTGDGAPRARASSTGDGSSTMGSGSSSPARRPAAWGSADGLSTVEEGSQAPLDATLQRRRDQLTQLVSALQGRMELMTPNELEIVRFLGGGAFGEVFLARWHGTDVAVKCLSPGLVGQARGGGGRSSGSSGGGSSGGGGGTVSALLCTDAVADLLREAAVLASLHHPNVVAVYGVVLPPAELLAAQGAAAHGAHQASPSGCAGAAPPAGKHPPAPAVVTEYLSAGSLRAAICSGAEWLKGGMAKVKLMLDTARGLDYLHGKRLVHFDLKSANLLVTMKDKVPCAKIADMGLTKQRRQTFVSGVNGLRGTLPWISPEVVKRPELVTEKADVWSFGVVMWEVWSGHEPFADMPVHALLHQLSSPRGLSLPIPGGQEWGDEPAPLEPAPGWRELMVRCWAQAPEERPSSRQLVGELEAMLARLRSARVQPRQAAPAAGSGSG